MSYEHQLLAQKNENLENWKNTFLSEEWKKESI
jgi:hypothetical protein